MLYCEKPTVSVPMEDTAYHAPIIEGRRRRSSRKRFTIIFFIGVLLIPLGIAVFSFFSNVTTQKPSMTPTPAPTQVVFPTDTPIPSASPSAIATPSPTPKAQTVDKQTGLDRAKLTVLVENGSGVVGAANKAAQILKLLGYTVSGTQNADNYDYLDVTISIKPAKAGYLPLLKKDLSSEYTIGGSSTTLDASAAADALVIIGK